MEDGGVLETLAREGHDRLAGDSDTLPRTIHCVSFTRNHAYRVYLVFNDRRLGVADGTCIR
jgi:hypothetical protein